MEEKKKKEGGDGGESLIFGKRRKGEGERVYPSLRRETRSLIRDFRSVRNEANRERYPPDRRSSQEF